MIPQWLALILNLLGAVVLPLGFFLWRRVEGMRANELRHLEERLERIERKMDDHLTLHLEHP